MSLAKLSERHVAIMREMVLDGTTPGEICEKYDIKSSSLSTMMSSPVWMAKVSEMKSDAFAGHRKKLDELIEPAIAGLKETVTSTDESIKLRSAKEILDRTGFIPGVRVEVDSKPVIQMYIPKDWDADGEVVVEAAEVVTE